NIAWGYEQTQLKQLFGTIDGNPGRWKKFLSKLDVTHGPHAPHASEATLNVGISYAGLVQLTPTWAPALAARFPAFAARMVNRLVQRGDKRVYYQEWNRRHVCLTIHAPNKKVRDDRVDALLALAKELSLELTDPLDPGAVIERDKNRVEHFGFADG